MYIIETEGLTKRFGAVQALAGVNLRVPAGTIFGFLGPNGAGKTTTMRILVGLLRATSGRASVLGLDAWRDSTPIRTRIGYLPGDVRLYEWMTGAALLSFCDRARGGKSGNEIIRLRERFDLNLDRRIRDYSRGMKQKLGLIQALMHRPELLILDEPTTGLDPLVRQTAYEELRRAVSEGRTVLFSSHTLSEVALLCDRVAIIREGGIIEDSGVAELRRRALRRVEFRIAEDKLQGLRFPAGWTAMEAGNGRAAGNWKGSTDELLRWLASLRIEDVTIGAPDLGDLFAAYYHVETDTGMEAAARR